jgi:siroheme synthase-like protein
MGYYPIVLQLGDRPCLVIGGGPVAERKVEALLAAGAQVTVVSPAVTPRIASWAEESRIRLIARCYRKGDLTGHVLVFATTGEGAVSAAVAAEGRRLGVWVNAADDPEHCDFILPSVLRRGELTVAVSTGGASPALSRALREELEVYLGENYQMLIEVASEVRRELRQEGVAAPADAWHQAFDPGLRQLVMQGRRADAKAQLIGRLRNAACP